MLLQVESIGMLNRFYNKFGKGPNFIVNGRYDKEVHLIYF